jgi:hypothetical protein
LRYPRFSLIVTTVCRSEQRAHFGVAPIWVCCDLSDSAAPYRLDQTTSHVIALCDGGMGMVADQNDYSWSISVKDILSSMRFRRCVRLLQSYVLHDR